MLSQKIEELRAKLDALVAKGATYDEIYEVSKELDKYITQYYKRTSE